MQLTAVGAPTWSFYAKRTRDVVLTGGRKQGTNSGRRDGENPTTQHCRGQRLRAARLAKRG